jgi:hypothetical protein
MSMSLEDVVSLGHEPDGSRPRRSSKGGVLGGNVTRRQFVRFAGVTGTAVGLTVLGWMPPALRKACACHTTYTIQEPCYPSSYTDSCSNPCCNTCGSVAGTSYCCTNQQGVGYGWHRHGISGNIDYAVRTASCNDRNAWRWTLARCCNGRENKRYRCSDGRYRVCNRTCGSWNNSVCPWQTEAGTAC